MKLEVEIKLSAPIEFNEPAFEEVGRLRHAASTAKRTFTTYFDTAGYDLLSCGAALRFRSEQAELDTATGVWTLKFAPPVKGYRSSRLEHEVEAAGEVVPDQFALALQVFGVTSSLTELAMLSAVRRSTILASEDGEPRIEIDDDIVGVLKGANQGETFREIEIELLDDGFEAEAEELARQLVLSGAEYARSSSKLEQAIENASNRDFIAGMLDRYERVTTGDLSVLASIVLDLCARGRLDIDELAAALGNGLENGSLRWFVRRLVAGLASEGSRQWVGEESLHHVIIEVSLELAFELRSVGHVDSTRLRYPSETVKRVADLVLERADYVRGNGVASRELAAILGDVLLLTWGAVSEGGVPFEEFFSKWS